MRTTGPLYELTEFQHWESKIRASVSQVLHFAPEYEYFPCKSCCPFDQRAFSSGKHKILRVPMESMAIIHDMSSFDAICSGEKAWVPLDFPNLCSRLSQSSLAMLE